MPLSKEVGLDSTLGARKDALTAPVPNTRAQQERTQQVVWEHAVSRPDYVDLMCLLFAPPRPDSTADGSLIEHPAGCPCKRCQQRYKRARARKRAEADPSIVAHGTASGHDYYGCRCEACRAYNSRKSLACKRRHLEGMA